MTKQGLLAEMERLKLRLEDSEATLHAIRNGEVEALVVSTPEGDQIFTLSGAERPYRLVIEMMQEGAAILAANGTILYCNCCFADMVKRPHEKVIGRTADEFFPVKSKESLAKLIKKGCNGVTNEAVFWPATGPPSPYCFP